MFAEYEVFIQIQFFFKVSKSIRLSEHWWHCFGNRWPCETVTSSTLTNGLGKPPCDHSWPHQAYACRLGGDYERQPSISSAISPSRRLAAACPLGWQSNIWIHVGPITQPGNLMFDSRYLSTHISVFRRECIVPQCQLYSGCRLWKLRQQVGIRYF